MNRQFQELPAYSPRDVARFASHVTPEPNTGCHLWVGYALPKGYGTFGVGRTKVLAHRFAFHVANGFLDSSQCVLHRCDTPSCVNPDHLFLGTYQDNVDDAIAKGRFRSGMGDLNRAKTHCKWGHEFTPENTRPILMLNGRTARQCRACEKTSEKRLRRAC